MNKILNALVILLLGLNITLTAGNNDPMPIDDADAKYWGLSLMSLSSGSGANTFFEYALSAGWRLSGSVSVISMKGQYEYTRTYYDPYSYSGYSTYQDPRRKRLWLVPAHIGIKRMLFVDKIANNFRPYLTVNAGPVMAFDPPNVPEFKERMNNIDTYLTWSGKLGGGIDFLYTHNTLISLFVGYDFSIFKHKIDPSVDYDEDGALIVFDAGKRNYSSMIVSIGFAKKF